LKNKEEKKRIDQLLVERGFVASKEKAQALIMSAVVLVNDQLVLKPGIKVKSESTIRLKEPVTQYVSRGAYKLKSALEQFNIKVKNLICMDIGASTGGFSEVLLEMGAEKVYAVDVGKNQLDWKIRSNPKVVSLEETNARYIEKNKIPDQIHFIVMDVSFISVKKIIPHIKKTFTSQGAKWVILIKPQFEVGQKKISKGGIVTNEEYRNEAVSDVIEFSKEIGLNCEGLIESPLKGTKGNVEYLVYFS